MLNALGLAFVDAVNVLLIGVLMALAIMLPAGRYRPVAALLLIGDWLGVLLLALVVLLVFDGLGDFVKHLVNSPVFGLLLIVTGLVTAVLTVRGGSDSSSLVEKILTPLKTPSALTVLVGFVLGLIQSATSVPFFAGLAVLSASEVAATQRYLGLLAYATVALSLPLLAGLLLGAVRRYPDSAVGRLFAAAKAEQALVARAAGWLVTVLLIGIGLVRLL